MIHNMQATVCGPYGESSKRDCLSHDMFADIVRCNYVCLFVNGVWVGVCYVYVT